MSGKFYRFLVLSVMSALIVLSVLCQGDVLAAKSKDKGNKKTILSKRAKGEKDVNDVVVKKAEPVPAGAMIKFKEVVHDFGNVTPDSLNDCNFIFTNAGTGILEITNTKGTCKCTVPDLQKKRYEPGESGTLKVSFHAPKFQGATTQNVFVFSNDPNNAKAELEIKAFVRSQVQVEPEKLSLSLVAANGGAKDITLKSIDNESYAITKITSQGDVFKFDFDPNKVSQTHILKPKVNVENLKRFLIGTVLIEINHPTCRTVKVDYVCMREFEASPSAIIVRDAVVKEAQKRTIYLISNYNEKIDIESAVSDKGIIKVLSQKETKNRFEFEAEITPPAREGKLRVFADTLHIKIKGKEQIDIPCRGFYKADKQ
ncbi:MAG: DUF1573 domain-containing protein [Phycisphaerae bacterium]